MRSSDAAQVGHKQFYVPYLLTNTRSDINNIIETLGL